MAEVNPNAFRRPWTAILLIITLVLPSLFFGLWYNYEPAKELGKGPRLICGGGGTVQIHRRSDTLGAVPADLLGYRPPVTLGNAMSAYFPEEEFSSDYRPAQMRWFGVVCPLADEAADAFEAHYRSVSNGNVPLWVTFRPLYSFDCSADYPYGFDFTVMVKLPMYHMQQFRLEMWSGRDTPLNSIRHLTNLSVVDYTPKRTAAGDVADPSFVVKPTASSPPRYEALPASNAQQKSDTHFAEQSYDGSSSTYSAASTIASTESVKACDKVTDECVQASMLTYTKSFKMIYPQTFGAGYNGRLLLQQPSSDNLWQVSITSDLGKTPSKVDIAIIAEPAKGTRAPFFRFLAGAVFLALFIALFISVKLVGLYTKLHDTTRLFSIIDPHHDEIIQEGWDDLRKLFQYWQFKLTETRSWWSAAARRRRYRRMADPAADPSRGEEGSQSGLTSSEETISPTAALAAKAKASLAAAATQGGYPSSSEEEGDVCRICRVGDPTSDLIAPCACAGTSKYIHRECLKQWRNMTINPEHKRICAECKTEYNVEMEVPQRSLCQRIYAICLPFIKLFAVMASFVALGYSIKLVARVVTLDPNIEWSVNFYHIFIGSLALCSIMIVFSNGLWYVVDYPKTLYQRLPALLVLGVVGPILLGYMAQFWAAIVFGTVITPEISFGAGVFTFISFVNNLLLKVSEMLTPPMESQRGRAPSIATDDDAVPMVVAPIAEVPPPQAEDAPAERENEGSDPESEVGVVPAASPSASSTVVESAQYASVSSAVETVSPSDLALQISQ